MQTNFLKIDLHYTTVNEQTTNEKVIFPHWKANKYKINYFLYYLKDG